MPQPRGPRAAALAAALCCAVVTAQPTAPAPNYYAGDQSLSLVSLQSYEGAVCNDGSPGAYYFSRGSNPNQWVLYLEGGASAAEHRAATRAPRGIRRNTPESRCHAFAIRCASPRAARAPPRTARACRAAPRRATAPQGTPEARGRSACYRGCNGCPRVLA